MNIYGSIGYTYLKNEADKPKYILLLADMHSQLPYCGDSTKISETFRVIISS